MGKRKDRRLAAQMAASRRVKLDLFTEPSGDADGTSRRDEVGVEQNSCAMAPNSPSSPAGICCLLGQRQENPLLFGQYSDDEVEEEKNEALTSAADDSASVDKSKLIQDLDMGVHGSTGVNGVAFPGVKQNSDGDLDSAYAVECEDVDHIEASDSAVQMAEACASEMSVPQSDQDAYGGWKAVMHEESNRYYYWNTVTGETSWEVPDVLAQGMTETGEQKPSALVDESTNGFVALIVGDSNLIGEHFECAVELEARSVATEGEKDELPSDITGATTVMCEAYVPGVSSSIEQASLVDCGTGAPTASQKEHPLVVDNEEKREQSVESTEHTEVSHTHSTRMMKFCENLLQKLQVPKGSGDQIKALDWRSKYIMEIEIRISDCKALASYGSSLLPFWWHTETQLKHLELAVEEAASQIARHEHTSNLEDLRNLFRDDKTTELAGTKESEGEGKDSRATGRSEGVQNQVHHFAQSNGLSTEICTDIEVNENMVAIHDTAKAEPQAGEDADMDVDMEVEDQTDADHATPAGAGSSGQVEQPMVDSLLPEPVDEFCAPPPPDEEWIPPPPPDNEPVTPPPPDEPPASLFPPPYAEPAPPLPYSEQYNITYSVPTYEYYAPTVSSITNATYYAPPESTQSAEPQQPSYYEPSTNVFLEAAATIVNPVEPIVYYDLPDAAALSGSIVSTVKSSCFYGESGSISYPSNIASDHTGYTGVAPELGYAPVQSVNVESSFSSSAGEVDVVSSKSSSISTADNTNPGVALVNESAVPPSVSADTENQPPKVVRSKKRTIAGAPTLRSNKKVSSLVDKWQAAKEELHGDKDGEPEEPLEMLKRKRQKEIEKWRAQQIASGVARDNANFQPLGGDWHERVRRKRAESSGQSSSEVTRNDQKGPDVNELSKDLPPGWQAYWDETSQQVYYGNAFSSETAWTRPTR